MENSNIEITLNEISEEQKASNEVVRQLSTSIDQLTERVDEFENILRNQKIVVPQIDTKPIEKIVGNGLLDIASGVTDALRKVRSNNVKVFLESDKTWLVRIILGIFFLTYFYFICQAWIAK